MSGENARDTRISKKLAYLLRHGAVNEGIAVDEHGWVRIDDALGWINKTSQDHVDFNDIQRVVATNKKQRFAISDKKIKAHQGHSMAVNLDLRQSKPPSILYHGTTRRFVDSIMKQGLKKMTRHHVHLTTDRVEAEKTGSRRGQPVVLEIDASAMDRDGFVFYVSENGVWLVDHVPPKFIRCLN